MSDPSTVLYQMGQAVSAKVSLGKSELLSGNNVWTGTSNNFQNNVSIGGNVSVGGSTALGSLSVLRAATFSDNVTVNGDLTVNGTTTALATTTLEVDDNFIHLSKGASDGPYDKDSGFYFERGSGSDAQALIWDESEGRFTLGSLQGTTGSGSTSTATYSPSDSLENHGSSTSRVDFDGVLVGFKALPINSTTGGLHTYTDLTDIQSTAYTADYTKNGVTFRVTVKTGGAYDGLVTKVGFADGSSPAWFRGGSNVIFGYTSGTTLASAAVVDDSDLKVEIISGDGSTTLTNAENLYVDLGNVNTYGTTAGFIPPTVSSTSGYRLYLEVDENGDYTNNVYLYLFLNDGDDLSTLSNKPSVYDGNMGMFVNQANLTDTTADASSTFFTNFVSISQPTYTYSSGDTLGSDTTASNNVFEIGLGVVTSSADGPDADTATVTPGSLRVGSVTITDQTDGEVSLGDLTDFEAGLAS